MEKFQVCNSVSVIRKERGYTQLKLAKLADFSQQYIINIERGVLIPSIAKAIKLAEVLGVCHGELFFKCEIKD